VDCNAERMGWPEFTQLIEKYQPKYYLTQLTAPTLENDMYGCFLAHARGPKQLHLERILLQFQAKPCVCIPSLDFALVGEPDLTMRDLLDHLEGKIDERSPEIQKMFEKHEPMYKPSIKEDGSADIFGIKGIAWRKGDEIMVNFPRPFIADLDDMPVPCMSYCHYSLTACL
jgi:anaerobic magnesium-protoporphyrin IX monomethyl ester cyclase